ncbi:ribbon-helix-helix protein, CopG family [Nitratireductor sp. XY-223]|uniref:ribbon-helix-helix protein, CopG family n=1 Tax=Nitratireductor sp. XY-223 TaxID=2561926 RepID=UPI0010AB38E1|nr:ribbon-helix-helix protein, CopG family [Nitratireductor sp. XY-223]
MKPRHNIYIDEETSAELEALAAGPGASKSAIIGDAVRHYIRHRGAHGIDEALRIRLDRLSRDMGLVRRDIDVLTESLAFFVRLYLTFNAHTPVPDKATQAAARERYRKFVEQVGRRIAGGRRSLEPEDGGEERSVERQIEPSDGRFKSEEQHNTAQDHEEDRS